MFGYMWRFKLKWLLISGYIFIGLSAVLLCVYIWNKIDEVIKDLLGFPDSK